MLMCVWAKSYNCAFTCEAGPLHKRLNKQVQQLTDVRF